MTNWKSAFKIFNSVKIKPNWNGDISGDKCKDIANYYNEKYKDRDDFQQIPVGKSTAQIREHITGRINKDLREDHPLWSSSLECLQDAGLLLNKSGSKTNRYHAETPTPKPTPRSFKPKSQIEFDNFVDNRLLQIETLDNFSCESPPSTPKEQRTLTNEGGSLLDDYIATCQKDIETLHEDLHKKYTTLDLKIDSTINEMREGLDKQVDSLNKVIAAQNKANARFNSSLEANTKAIKAIDTTVSKLNIKEIAELGMNIKDFRKDNAKRALDLEDLTKRVDEFVKNTENNEVAIKGVENDIEQHELKIDNVEKELKKLTAQVKELSNDYDNNFKNRSVAFMDHRYEKFVAKLNDTAKQK